MAEKKERLDVLLVNKGIITSRERAKSCIMAGEVFVNGQRVDKAGEKVSVDSQIEYRGEKLKYVSRGGLKLEKAMKVYPITLEEKVCMDIGASTGGFTDCMLQNGAKKVFSVDVGYGQFAWKLRCDERVVCMERTNIRYVTPEDIGELLDFASIDVSFISLRTIMPAVINLLKRGLVNDAFVILDTGDLFSSSGDSDSFPTVYVRDINVTSSTETSNKNIFLEAGSADIAKQYE